MADQPDATFLIDGCADAIIGFYGEPVVAVYCYDKLVDCFIEQFRRENPPDDMTDEAYKQDLVEQALEWISFNITDSMDHLGPGAPLIVYPGGIDEVNNAVVQYEENWLDEQ